MLTELPHHLRRLAALALLLVGVNAIQPAFAQPPVPQNWLNAPVSDHTDLDIFNLVNDPTRDAIRWNLVNSIIYTQTRNIDWAKPTDISTNPGATDPRPSGQYQTLQIWEDKRAGSSGSRRLVMDGGGSFPPSAPTRPSFDLVTANMEIRESWVLLQNIDLFFNARGPSYLTLNNAVLEFGPNSSLSADPGYPLTIESIRDTSVITNWKRSYTTFGNEQSAINVRPSATLILREAELRFDKKLDVNLDQSRLVLEGSSVRFLGGTTLQLNDGARLELNSGSQLTKTHLESHGLQVDGGSEVRLAPSASYTLAEMQLNGGSRLDVGRSATFNVDNDLKSFNGNNYIKNSEGTLTIGRILACDGSSTCNAPTINVQSDTEIFVDGVTVAQGGEITFNPTGGAQGLLFISPTGPISEWGVDGSGSVLAGNFNRKKASAIDQLFLTNGGTLSPGLSIGVIGIEGDVIAGRDSLGNETPQPGRFEMELNPTGPGRFGDNDEVDIGGSLIGKANVVVLHDAAAGPANADAYDGKIFTLIRAGTLDPAGQITAKLPLVVDNSIPVLVEFTVNDYNSDDFYQIAAKKKNYVTLLSHPYLHAPAGTPVVLSHHTGTGVPPSGTQPPPGGTSTQVSPPTAVVAKREPHSNRNNWVSLSANAANAGNPKIKSALDTMTHDQVPAHFDTEHAESYSSYMTVAMEGIDLAMDSVFDNVAGKRGAGDDVQTRRRVWADANYRDGDVDGEDGLGNFDYTLTNLVIGGDMVSLGMGELGGFLGYGRNDMDEHDLINQDFTSDVFYLGLYLNSEDVGGWDIRSTLGYAYGDTESERDVNFGPYNTRAKGSFNSNSFFAGVRGSTPWYSNDNVTLSPELGLVYVHYSQDSFRESGDPDLALALDSATAQSLVTSVGIKADFASLSETQSVKPLLFARYEYDWLATDGDDHEIDAGLVAHPELKLPFVGQNRGPHALVAGVGLSSDANSDLKVKGGLLYSYASHGSEWGAALNLQYAF